MKAAKRRIEGELGTLLGSVATGAWNSYYRERVAVLFFFFFFWFLALVLVAVICELADRSSLLSMPPGQEFSEITVNSRPRLDNRDCEACGRSVAANVRPLGVWAGASICGESRCVSPADVVVIPLTRPIAGGPVGEV